MVMAGINLLPSGEIFGTDSDDEFSVVIDGVRKGIFKRFEYLSLPFSITGNRELFEELLNRAQINGTSFSQELQLDQRAREVVERTFSRMEASPAFSGQALELILPQIYIRDQLLTRGLPRELNFEESLARVIFAWKELTDFYCIEGLVGGQGKDNPLNHNGRPHSLRAGTLDSLEQSLPSLFENLAPLEKNKALLQLSSVIERDYHDLNRAISVLQSIHGIHPLRSEEREGLVRLEELSRESLETNIDQGKFINSVIRFHNWLPLSIKEGELRNRSVYDSICLPSKRALELAPPEIADLLSGIKDATSPKGIALARLVQEDRLSGKERVFSELQRLSSPLHREGLDEGLKDYFTLSFDDHAFYTGMVGGKWKGLKLLHDAKQLFNFSYKLAPGFSVTSVAVNYALEREGILSEIISEETSLTPTKVEGILQRISALDLRKMWPEIFSCAFSLGDHLMVRSSMYGEDGRVNFAGTYDSVSCNQQSLEPALKKVMASFFSFGAIKAREEAGLAHLPGISMVVQKHLEGTGGVLHLTEQEVAVSYAHSGEEAVGGNGNYLTAGSLSELITNESPLFPIKEELQTLQEVFGSIDVEFICCGGKVYLTQMRSKYVPTEKYQLDRNACDLTTIGSLEEMSSVRLDSPSVVHLGFLQETLDINQRREEIFDFIRRNREYILGIEGDMPAVAHLPNNIEGNFGIPYFMIGGK